MIPTHHKIIYYYLAAISVFLIFLKVAASNSFKDLVDFSIAFLPFGIILCASFYSFYQYQKDPENKPAIVKNTLLTILSLLFITLLFYILYSPQSFAPTVETLNDAQQSFGFETYFLILAYLSVITVSFTAIFFFIKFYQKSRGTYQGSMQLLFKHSLYVVFSVLFFLLSASVVAYPQAYAPITGTTSDLIYTLTMGKVDLPKFDGTANKRIDSLKKVTQSLDSTYKNLQKEFSNSNNDLATAITETKNQLDGSLSRTNKDLKNNLTNDIADKFDTSGGTVEGKLVVEKTLTVNSLSNLEDVLPKTDDMYDLGSVSKGWNNVYIHRLFGSSIITIGDANTSHGMTSTDDLLVSGDFEANGLVYLDGGADLGNGSGTDQNIINLADPINDQDAATKAYVDNQAGAGYHSGSGITLNMYDGVSTYGLITNIGNSGTNFTVGGGLTLAGVLNAGSSSTHTLGSLSITAGDVTGLTSLNTISAAELGYVKGVASAIQTQLGLKQASSANLTSLAGLTFASTSFVKMTSAGNFGLDTNTYSLSNHNHNSDYLGISAKASDSNLLDNLDSTAFAILAGQSGGQTLYGGTSSGNTLTLLGNSADAATTAMAIASTGYLTIGSASIATGNTVTIQDSNGSCTLDPGSGASWTCTSDKTLKKDITPLGGSLNSILALKPSTFKMIVDNSNGVGFIAQEVTDVLPDAVSMMPNGKLGVAEGKFIPYLVGSIQEQQTQIAGKEAVITTGTAEQYWTGEKKWATLNKNAVGLGNVENTALSTWAGSSNITTLGTITAGTWNGTAVAVANGGTGTTNGSITGTGALAFSAGGTNQNIALTPSGMGNVVIQAGLSDQSTAIPSTLMQFNDGSGTAVGSITFASNATSYNTFSDVRLKENITDTNLTVADLMKIDIRDFTWKSDPEQQITHGVIAQELANVYPAAVTIPNGKDKFWMVDYSKLTPLIVKSIQDQQSQISEITTTQETITSDISNLNLKTDENITTFADLQKSVDKQFVKISKSLNDQEEINSDQEIINKEQESVNSEQDLKISTLETTLQSQIDELKKLTNQDLNIAQINLNTEDMVLIKQILGITDKSEGDISILGSLTAKKVVVDGIETGAITVVVNDKDKKTIGDDTIKIGDASVIVKTKAITKDSKIFVTFENNPNAYNWIEKTKDSDDKYSGFTVNLSSAVDKDTKLSWWIVESK